MKNSRYLVKIEPFFDNPILVMLYYSLIYPFLTYGVHVWGLTFSSFLTQLFNYLLSRKKAIRIICFSEPKSHSEPLFKSLNLLKLNDVIESHILSFVYQCYCYPLVSVNISNLLLLFIPIQRSCNRNLYVASLNTTQYGLRSLKFTGLRLWNSLLTSISNSEILLEYFFKPLRELYTQLLF